jgi:hypothetical protein
MNTNVEPDLSKVSEIYCKKARCRLLLAKVVLDQQAIEFGNVRIWNTVRYFCSSCGTSSWFQPKPLPIELEEEEI